MENKKLSELKKLIIENFNNFDIPCYIQKANETRFHYIFDIILKDIKSLSKVNKLIKVLQLSLHNENITMDKSNYDLQNTSQIPIVIKIKKLKIENLSYFDIKEDENTCNLNALIGLDENNLSIYHDFKKDGNLFIFGDNQTGKTTLLNTIIESMSRQRISLGLQIAIIENNNQLGRWKNFNNLYPKWEQSHTQNPQWKRATNIYLAKPHTSDNYYEISDLLSNVIKRINMRRRNSPIILIIDDLISVLNSSRSGKEYLMRDINKILTDGPEKNIFTIISTSKSMISSFDIKAFKTFNKRVCFKTIHPSESMKIIENKNACDILHKCVAIYKDILTNSEQLLQIPSIDCAKSDTLAPQKQELAENQSLSHLLTLQEKMQANDTLKLLVQNFIEKKGKIQYLDFFVAPELSLDTTATNEPFTFTKSIKETIGKLKNGEEIFFECQRIKTEPTIKIGNESIFIDKTTYSIFNELKYFYETLVAQGFIGNTIEDRDAFYLFVYNNYRNYLEGLYYDLKNKYDIASELDDEIVNTLLNDGKSIAEVKNFVALKNFIGSTNQNTSFDLCFENLGTIVEDKMNDIKQKQYLNNLLNLNKNSQLKTLHEIDLMSGPEFEIFVSELFNKLGYETEVTKISGDQGIDVLAKRNGVLIAIQAKCYSNVVGNHAIMEAVAGMQYYKANKCLVITNSTFTKSAIELAKANDVELWDRSVLQEKIEEI